MQLYHGQWETYNPIRATLEVAGVESPGMGDDQLVGLTKASEETGLSREALRKMFHAGLLPGAQRVGNAIGIRYPQAGDVATHKICADR
jgi:hypothetical protein